VPYSQYDQNLPDEIFKCKDKKPKDKTMYEDYLQHNYIPKDIAEYIGVHFTTVSRANL